MPSAYLNSKVQDAISGYCKRNNVGDTHKAEAAYLLLSLTPTQRVYLIEAINHLDREETQENLRAMSERMKNIDRADALSATLSEGQEVEL